MKSPSHETWCRAISEANDGNAQPLLELLLTPQQTDGQGNALPGSFFDLPDDRELRYRIVKVMMLGPWKAATSLQELMTRTNWGEGKPRLSDREVAFAAVAEKITGGQMSVERLAEGLGVGPEALQKRIAKQRKAK